ncbi:MAG: DNA mismatch repair endonuclease MutL [Oscillospiraceae bacterium]|nr:DNA mismatch repair endonuclease MutL [Oscillospiraceae bacterium]
MSTVINILSPHVADLIAAGEVVERPASVVKELVENAIDAGARNVTVALENGGMRSIRVTDDGCGMSPEDAGVAFLRHATSKLRDERGLEAISTLGFRGEALAAISAVSRIELVTRERGAAEGTRVVLTAGEIDEMGPVGAPEGTTMLVRDLFYNTPARRKFLKSDRAEGSACAVAALKCALGHPEVSVRLLRDGAEVFFSPGDGQKKSAVYALLGRDLALGMLSCVGASEGLRVEGYVSAPHACRGNRAMQFFFLNGRCFRSVALQTALEQAYKNSLLTGRYPACALWLTLSPGKVDVNVHPTKSEVKFSEERLVFETLYAAVRAALDETTPRHTAEIRLSPGTQKAVPRGDFYQSMTAAEFREGLGKSGGGAGKAAPRTPAREQISPAAVQTVLDLRSPTPEYRTGTKLWTGELPPVGRFAQAAPEPASPVGRDALIAPQAEQRSGPAYPNGTRSGPYIRFPTRCKDGWRCFRWAWAGDAPSSDARTPGGRTLLPRDRGGAGYLYPRRDRGRAAADRQARRP